MAPTPEQIYEFANILRRRASSDGETLTKTGDMISFTDQYLVKLPSDKTDAKNPIWSAVRSSGLISLLLDIAANGEKNEDKGTTFKPRQDNRHHAIRPLCLSPGPIKTWLMT